MSATMNLMVLGMLGSGEARLYDDSLTGWVRGKDLPMVPLEPDASL